MPSKDFQLVFIGSTGGGVLSRLLPHAFVRELTLAVVSDRPCGFLTVAERNGVQTRLFQAETGLQFSDALRKNFGHREDLIFISFYTKLFRGNFLENGGGRIFNCHPSLLPSHKGMQGFEDTMDSSSLFMGCTLHQVDEGMDSGRSVLQVALPIDRGLPLATNRHRVFLAQYYSTLQFIKWIHEGRFSIAEDGLFSTDALTFQPSPFSPNLDSDFFNFIGEGNELF